jgi:hypothetical protein
VSVSFILSQIIPKKYFCIGGDYFFKGQSWLLGEEFTSLEKYLYMVRKPTHKKIIAYLKGDIQEIILK